MNRKALVAALIIALIGVALLLLYKKRFEEKVSGGDPVAVLMAVQDIPLGTVLTDRMLGVRYMPEAYVEFRHIRARDASRIIGVRMSMEVKANESILWSDLATTTGERRDLSSLVRSGMRAITIRADATSGFGGLLRPGDRVDAFLTVSRSQDEDARVTIPLLQNVIVLAVGQDTGAIQDGTVRRPGSISQVTLGVTVTQAQLVAFATDRGRLTLVLRNPDDIAVVKDLPETTVQDILEAERKARSTEPGERERDRDRGADDKRDDAREKGRGK
jgi:pilus assembly protein CpaB